ncbi:hypothetical protein ACFYUD_16805 [Nocardia tengchongensis]|uniref:hypothetical protein n=1 Tax=Nocardia tengchongensis TaxID=2055889 RepID=UPI00367C093E
MVSLAWFAFWALHLLIMVQLYLANKVVLLGTVALVLGKPALVVTVAVTWLWVRPPRTAAPLYVTDGSGNTRHVTR